MQGDITISAIIPALNEEQHIERAIRSVQSAFEIVVVDGGSTDATKSIAERNQVRVLSSEQGRGHQLRTGGRQAQGDVLLFLHADSWLAASGLDQLREHASSCNAGPIFGCFRQCIDDSRFRFRVLEFGNAFRSTKLRMPYGDQAVFVDRQHYEKMGGFDEIPLMEDVLFARRMRKICCPTILPGPIHLSARRWQAKGVVRQTLRNWLILSAYSCGVSPTRLAAWYR